jgi:glycosyltransferase involved in cell wall biosynthesis
MNKVPCKWVGALFDTSGYASASRSYVGALINSNAVDLTVQSVTFEKNYTDHGKIAQDIKALENRKISHRIQVVHLTPENYINTRVTGLYNIGYTTWETDKLPEGWVNLCNMMNEIWVPSSWNKEVFAACGVRKPICVIPHGIEAPDLEKLKPMNMGVDNDVFVFYSIFQWLERKNPTALLKAYLTEFKPDEKVILAIKSYRLDTSAKEQEIIKNDIAHVKQALRIKDEYPSMRFFGTLLSAEQMQELHMRGDCFVLPHRGEGFGIPHAEAMSYGKPVITTNYSGNLEFMKKDNSYLVDYFETPVYNMLFPLYNARMNWAEPSVMHMRKLMRYVFEHRVEAALKGQAARKYIQENLNWEVIGKLMVKRLREIQKELP